MLDIKFIRENKELVALGAKKKHISFDVEELLRVDDKRREIIASLEKKRAEQNKVSNEVVKTEGAAREKVISEMKTLKATIEKEEADLKDVMKEWQTLMLAVPNIPDMSVPDGKDETENKEVKTWGPFDGAQGKPQFAFKTKNHIELMELLGMADFERGAKAHGFRGYFLKGAGAELSWAIWNYAANFTARKILRRLSRRQSSRKNFFTALATCRAKPKTCIKRKTTII